MKQTAVWLGLFLTVALVFCGCKSQQKPGTPEETGSTQMELIDAAENFEGIQPSQGESPVTEPSETPAFQGGIELPMIPG